MSCSGRYCSHLRDQVRVVGPARRPARRSPASRWPEPGVTANLTQSRIGVSLVWHIRQMSPAATGVDEDLGAGLVDHPYGPGLSDLERLVVRAVLLGGLRHQPDVGHRAHGRWVVRAVGLAVLDRDLIDARVGRVGDNRESVRLGPVRPPHVAADPDHRRHGGVHDHVARHVQIGDAAVGIHHGQLRTLGQPLLDRRLDLRAVLQCVESGQDAAEAVVGAEPGGGQVGAVALKDRR